MTKNFARTALGGLVSAICLIASAVDGQQIIYVNQAAPASSLHNGGSWANAFQDLQSALAAAHPTSGSPVSIFVASGTYKPTTGTNQSASFVLKSYLSIMGGFRGTESNFNQRPNYGSPTVLSGDIGIPAAHPLDQNNIQTANIAFDPNDPGLQDNCYNVLYASNVTDILLDQIYVTGGYANVSTNVVDPTELISMAITPGPTNTSESFLGTTILPLDSRVAGGGLCLINPASAAPPSQVTLILNDCVFANNGARGYGGGVAVKFASVAVNGSTFANNFAGQEGGGYWGMNCFSDIYFCDFLTNVSYGDGGGLVYQSIPTDYTVDPFSASDESNRQTTEAIVGTSLDSAKFATKLYRAPSVDGSFVTKLRSLLPGNPFQAISAGASVSDQALEVGTRLSRSLSWITIAVTAVDVVADIVSAAGEGNSTFVKNWTWFSENFNNYATPQGWIYYLFDAIGLIRSPSATQLADQVKQQEEGVYNQAGYSSVVGCQFIGNSAAGEGGGYYCLYDNVQVEDCVFLRNGAQDAGAMANFAWTKPIIISCAFVENFGTAGQSAVVNAFHARAQYANCTFSYNVSGTAGYAMGNQLAADVTICNSIFWGNTNVLGTNFAAGADIFTSVHTNLDSGTLSNYNAGLSDGTFVDWVANCDVSWSDVQSLRQLPLGANLVEVVFPDGFSPSYYQLRDYLATWDQQLFQNDLDGLLDALGYTDTGEGFRTNILDPRKGNISIEPILINGYIPSRFSPVLNRGNVSRLTNGVISSLTDWDAERAPRFYGANVDMGAIEYNGGGDPFLIDGFPVPNGYLPNVMYVTPGGRGNQSGNDWADATGNLRAAMTNQDFEVWVAAGTYYPSANGDRTASFTLGTNVQVYGGFLGSETNFNDRNWVINPTVLSGDIGVHGNDADNSFHVIANTNIDALSILDGFTITKGRGTNGGGIYNIISHPFLTNCVFVDNQVTGEGGAIYSSGIEGSPLNNCSFISNSAGIAGGAIYLNSRTFIEDCIFVRNSSALGGAVCFSNAAYNYVYNSLFVSNWVAGGASAAGGAIESQQTGLTVFNSTFSLNYDALAGVAVPTGAAGIDFQSTDPSRNLFIENSIFWRNFVTNSLGLVGTEEEQQITTNSTNPYFITDTLIQGLSQFAGSTTSGNIDVDPLFANARGGDFSLVRYSPALDAGNPAGQSQIMPTDLAGNPRVANQSIDLGAYEYQGVPTKVSFQISVSRSCDDSGAVYSLQLLPLNGAVLPLTAFQWEVNKSDGAGFVNVSDGGVYSGTSTNILTITHPSLDMNGYRYVVATSSSNLQFTSQSGTIYVSPSRFYVNANATGVNTGLTWADAFTDLQSALAAAEPCSQIWVAEGTYYPSAIGDTSAAFRMRSDIGIYGGFSGVETNLSQRNWLANPTILSGNLGNPALTNDNSLNVIFNYGNQVGLDCGPTAVLDGFTVRDAVGSGMINFYASPTVRNCIFTSNSGSDGGAMRNFFSSSPLVGNCVFENNSSVNGGAVNCSQDANASFVNCLFANNNSSFEGGAIAVSLSDAHLINCTVVNNFSAISGGGIYSQSATVEFLNSILWGNSDQERIPTATSAQAFLDIGGVLNQTNSCVQGSTNIANGNMGFDPLFAGSAAENFRLTLHSPAIDAGGSALAAGYFTDLDGNNRIVNSAVDMGAYEFPLLPGSPVKIYQVPEPLTACGVAGNAVFSVTGTNGSAASFVWQVNKNDGLGFAPVVINASAGVVLSNSTSLLILSNISPVMNGYLYEASVGSTGFATPPALLTVQPAGIIYVNNQSHSGAGNGTSWANAFPNLQQAINSASSCSEIWVAQGTYSPASGSSGGAWFQLVSGVGVYGGFAGTETTRSQRNWTNHPVTVTGGIGGNALFNNVAQSAPIDASAVLDGFVLQASNGFAINNFRASPTIQNCSFTGNSQFAIFNRNGAPTISSCVFTNNSGFSIYNQQSSPVISSCVFGDNQTGSTGGAIYNWQSSPVIADCLFETNSASSGGAIYNDNLSFAQIDRCRFLGNSSTGNGGAIYNSPTAAPIVGNSVFDRNSSGFQGGAIADYGGGMRLAFCTVARNSASYSGAGLYFQGQTATVDSCIFWENFSIQNPDSTPVEKIQVDNSTGSLTISNSIVQGLASLTGPNNIPFDPLFTNLAGGNLQLTAFSPAINSGNTPGAAHEFSDAAGRPRVFGGVVDRGAYEFQSARAGTLNILGLPQSLTACVLTRAEFDIVTQAGDTNVFQWQMFSGSSFVSVPNSAPYVITVAGNTNSLVIPSVSLSMNGTVFRVVSVGSGYTSPPFTLTVTPATVIYVNGNASTSGSGSSWATALTNLQTAMLQGDVCSEIWVARGVYFPGIAPDGNPSLVMKKGLRVYGGFAGTETNLSQRNWTSNVVVLKGYTNAAVIENIGAQEVIDSSAVLDGFTIDGGNYSGNAVLNLNASPTFQNCIFVNGSPGIWNADGANPLILSCGFSNNTAGAIVNEQCAGVVSNCFFAANGGVGLVGGAIYNFDASPIILACQFANNSANEGSAISLDGNSSIVVKRSFFEGNSASAVGTVYCASSTALFADDLFAGNLANQGDAIFAVNSRVVLNNCTLTGNAAISSGGGVYNQGGSLAATNSIFWNNTDSTGSTEIAQVNNTGGIVSISHSIVTGLSSYAGNQNVGFDPLFQAPSGNNFTPASASPAIDAGINSAVASGDADLNGNARVVRSTVDIGAIEVQNPGATTVVDLAIEPASQATCPGGTVSFTVVGGANSGAQFMWQVDSGSGFSAIPNDGFEFVSANNNSASVTISNTPANFNYSYRFLISSAGYTSPSYQLLVLPRRIIYVNAAATGNGTGTNWANAFTSFAAALTSGDACSQVWVAAGHYAPTSGQPAEMKSGLEVYGGFAGTETNISQRNWPAHPTILSANAAASAIFNQGFAVPINRTAVLDGFVLTGNSGQPPIENQQASPTIRNCVFQSNVFYSIANANSSPLIYGCVFTNNGDVSINIQGGAPTITNCVFTANQADGGSAISSSIGAQTTILGCLFNGNSAVGQGGAIDNSGATIFVVNCVFNANSARGVGGAVANTSGGAAYFTNSVFYGGAAFGSAAIYNGATLTLVNCTVTGNSTESQGGAVSTYAGTTTLLNTILSQNTTALSPPSVEGEQVYSYAGLVSATNCLVQGLSLYAGHGNIGGDPLFLNPAAGNFQLSPSSPAINAGLNLLNSLSTDVAGQPRVQLGTIDMGAYESAAVSGSVIQLVATPTSQSVCASGVANFAVQSQTPKSFVWQYFDGVNWDAFTFNSGSGTWTGPALGAYHIVSNSTSSTLTVSGISSGMSGYQFRFIIPGSYTGSAVVLTAAPSSVIYVRAGASSGGNGQSWGTAYKDLESALASVEGCRNEIWLAGGTYTPVQGSGAPIGFSMPAGVAIYGGFTGTETNRAQRDWRNNSTILTGQNNQTIVGIDGTAIPIGAETVFDGLVLQSATGAALSIINASPAINNCVFRNNSQGALLNSSSSIFQNCSFVANNSVNGAGLEAFSGNVSCLDCLFSNNTATANGGGLYLQTGNLNLANCLFVNNSASYGGGIDCASAGTCFIVNCTISGNTATGGGAGFQGSLASLSVANSILWNNSVNDVADEPAQLATTPGSVSVTSSCVEGLSLYAGNNNFGNDPLFENPEAGQFALQPCSPAINAGANGVVSGISTDIAGSPRVANGVVDLGAYEFQGAPSQAMEIVTQPVSINYCAGGSNYFVVSVLGAGLNYQWLGDNNDGNGFVPLTDSSLFSGTASPILSINSASSAENGMVFQCAITSGAGCSLISSVATLTYPSTRWYVNAAVAGGNGSSWAQAFRTLDQALNAPFQVCNNEIWVAQGTYVPPAGGYAMSDNVALYGGFSGAETNLMQRNWNAFHTILDGHQSVSALIQNVNDFAPISPLARLDGFTLQNATSYAIYNHVGGSPTLANCIFRSNGVTAVYNYNATPLITNCTFLQNGSIGNTSGGAIYDYEPAGPFLVENCIFQGNISGTDGGAIYDEFGALTLVNCLFSGNYAADFGGAVGAGGEGGSVVVRNCTFSGNQSGFPGAAVDFGVPCLVYNSIFWNNFTPYGTAIQHTNEDAQVTIFNDGTPRVFNTCIEGLTVVGGQFSGQGNTGGNPDFVQNIDGSTAPLVGGDFHVTSCSSVIDAGSNSQVTLSIDLDGNPRILGSKVDLGAYEGAGATAYFVSQPLNRSAALSNTVQFVAVASKTNLTYQWQFQKTTNGTFLNLTNDAQYSGVTTAALIIGHAVSALDNYKFRCVIVDQCSTILSTAAAFHFLYAPPLVYNVGATNYEGFAAMGQFQAVDPQGLPLTYGILTQPKNGLVDLSGAPNFQYIATNPRFFGSDSFTYYASNGFTNSVPATVFVTLVKVEQNPSANNLTLAVPENTSGSVTLTGSDYNGDALTFFVAVPPQHGALNVIGSNAFYMPATNYSGLDIFIYQSSNGIYASGSATVSISVNHFNRPAVARPDGATIYSGQSVVIPVLQNDVDLDNNPLSVVGVTQGTNGSVTFTSSNVTYIHNGSITTNDHFSYSISDGQGNIVAGAISMVILQPGTSFLVTNTADSGPGSLRSAIAGANTVASLPYQIIFSPALAGKTIALSTTGENAFGAAALVLSNNVSIDAKNAPGLIVARDPSSSPMRLFHLIGGAHGAFRNIVLTNGFALGAAGNVGIDGEGAGGGAGGFGGAIYSEGSLSLSNVTLSGNLASGGIGGTSAGGGSPSGGNGGGVNGGVGAGSAGGFGGGGAGASAGTQTPGGAGGFGAGQGGGASSGAQTGGVGGFGAGGGSGGGSQFSGGGGAGFGGAVFVRDGTFTASNCVFSGNAVSGGAAGNGPAPNYQGFPGQGFGGGVFNYNGTAILSACVFVNNRADVCDGLYNIGDAAIAAATVLQSSFTNLTGLTNFFQSVINGGSASGLSDNLSSFSENQPFIQAISNQTTVGPLTFGFTISPPVSSSFNVTAASSNPALIPAAGVMLGGSGQDRSLTLSPAFGASGVDNVTVQVIDGNLSMSQVFPVNISRNLSVFAPLGGSVTIPIFAASSGWAVTGVGLAASGSVIFNSTSITYSNSAAFTTSDGFTYQISNGSSTAAGSVAITILTNVVPFAVSQSVTAFTNAPVNITLSGSDLYNDPVTFALGAQPQHGVLSGSPPNLIYTPANNFTGPDSFKFHVNNRFTNSADATVSIAVREIFGAAVTTAGDSGPGSLRAALSQANADSFNLWRISFAAGLPGHGILLSSIGDNGFGASALVVSNLLVIDGGSAGSTIACDPNGSVMRLLRVATNAQLTLLNLTLTNGQALGGNGGDGAGGGGGGAGMGGAVYNEGSLTVSNVVLTKNRAAGGSGGHYSTGGQPDYLVAGGAGGGVNGGTGQEAASGVGGTFGGGGAGGGSTISGFGSGGGSGFGAINGGSYPVGPYTVFGGAGGFGGGGGGGWICGGGGGAGMGGAIFNHGGAVTISASIFSNNMVSGGHGYIFNNAQGAGGSGFGGAVFNYNGIVTISNSVMTQNSATNGGAIYSIGDGATARLTLQGAVLTNNAPLDFVQNEINNGFAAATAHGDIITQGSPWLQDIADQTASGAATLPLMLSAPITSASNRVVSVASDNPSFLGSSNFFVTLANTTGSLTVSPPAIPGTANIDLTLTDGSLSYSDTFKFTVSYNLTAVVNAGQSVTLQVFPANSQLSIIGVSQGVNGSVTFTPRTLTYNQTGPSGAGDSFTYTFSDGAHNFVGNVTITIQRSTVTINSTADDGPGSLRAAIALANGAPGVSWRLALAPSLAGQTILMGTVGDNTFGPSALAIAGTVTLDGSAAPGAALSRNANGPVMRLVIIEPTGTLTLNNLALQNGLAQGASGGDGESTGGGGAGFGGAILNTGSLVASNMVFALNQAIGGNGGDVVALGDAGNGGGPSGGIGGLPSGDDGLNGGFGSGGGGGMLTNEFGNGSSGGFGAGEGGGTNGVNFGGTGGFGGGGGGGLGGGGGGGLGAGAAIFNGGSASFVQCLFTSNTVTSGAGGTGYMSPSLAGTPGNAFGGALFNYNGQLSISNSTFSGNSASNGGGIYLLADDTTNEIFLSGVTANDLKGRVDLVTTALDGGSLEILTSSNSFSSEASPSIGAIANVTTNRAFSVAVPASAPTGVGSYSIEAISLNSTLIPNSNLVVTGTGSNAVLTVTPAVGQTGSSMIGVVVTDTGVSVGVMFQVTITSTLAAPTTLGASLQSGGGLHIHFQGAADSTYGIQVSTNLVKWLPVGPATQTSSGVYDFVDTNTVGFKSRFYRVDQTP